MRLLFFSPLKGMEDPMGKKMKKEVTLVGGILALLLVLTPCLWSESKAKGNVLGFVYENDGTTPIEGAVVKLKSVSSGEVYESNPSNTQGVFQMENVKSGIYIYGVNTSQGNFNSDGMIGVRFKENETARMSLSLSRYDEGSGSNTVENPKEDDNVGEYLVGEITKYDPGTGMAKVRIIQGLLEKKDRVHVLGEKTDFYQNVKNLELNGAAVKRLFVKQTGTFKAKNGVEVGDRVYLTDEKGGLFAFLSAPCGLAALIAGTAAVGYVTYDQVTEANEASAFK